MLDPPPKVIPKAILQVCPAFEAARNLEVNENMLGRWKRQLVSEGEVMFPSKGRMTLEQEAESKEVRERIARLLEQLKDISQS